MTTYDLSKYTCATYGCAQPVVFVRQTSHPTAFYGECQGCHQRIERDLATRAERERTTPDRRALAEALIAREPTWSLRNMIHALSIFSALNTQEESERLDLAHCELHARRRSQARRP